MKKTIVSYALAAVGVLTLGLATNVANATTINTSVAVSATVVATCTITANPLAFGNYTGVVKTATTNLSVTCTNTTPYNVGLDAGTTSGSTVTNRSMVNGGVKLNYQLTKDSGYTTNWGNTVGTDTASGAGTGSAQSLTIYGQIPASQYVTPGSYTDTVTASVIY
jgi:spore coat protein U-like protein